MNRKKGVLVLLFLFTFIFINFLVGINAGTTYMRRGSATNCQPISCQETSPSFPSPENLKCPSYNGCDCFLEIQDNSKCENTIQNDLYPIDIDESICSTNWIHKISSRGYFNGKTYFDTSVLEYKNEPSNSSVCDELCDLDGTYHRISAYDSCSDISIDNCNKYYTCYGDRYGDPLKCSRCVITEIKTYNPDRSDEKKVVCSEYNVDEQFTKTKKKNIENWNLNTVNTFYPCNPAECFTDDNCEVKFQNNDGLATKPKCNEKGHCTKCLSDNDCPSPIDDENKKVCKTRPTYQGKEGFCVECVKKEDCLDFKEKNCGDFDVLCTSKNTCRCESCSASKCEKRFGKLPKCQKYECENNKCEKQDLCKNQGKVCDTKTGECVNNNGGGDNGGGGGGGDNGGGGGGGDNGGGNKNCQDSCNSLGFECGTHIICGKQTNCGPNEKSCVKKFGSCSVTGTKSCNNGKYSSCNANNPISKNCKGKECGPDGCGGSCGSCKEGQVCNKNIGKCQKQGKSCTTGSECNDDIECTNDVCIQGRCENIDNCEDGQTCNKKTGKCEGSNLKKFQCSNGIDDDGDNLIDYPDDLGCINAKDNDESDDYSVTKKCFKNDIITYLNGIPYGKPSPCPVKTHCVDLILNGKAWAECKGDNGGSVGKFCYENKVYEYYLDGSDKLIEDCGNDGCCVAEKTNDGEIDVHCKKRVLTGKKCAEDDNNIITMYSCGKWAEWKGCKEENGENWICINTKKDNLPWAECQKLDADKRRCNKDKTKILGYDKKTKKTFIIKNCKKDEFCYEYTKKEFLGSKKWADCKKNECFRNNGYGKDCKLDKETEGICCNEKCNKKPKMCIFWNPGLGGGDLDKSRETAVYLKNTLTKLFNDREVDLDYLRGGNAGMEGKLKKCNGKKDNIIFFGWSSGAGLALENINNAKKFAPNSRYSLVFFDPTNIRSEFKNRGIPPSLNYFVNIRATNLAGSRPTNDRKEIEANLMSYGIDVGGHWGVQNEIVKTVMDIYILSLIDGKSKNSAESLITKFLDANRNYNWHKDNNKAKYPPEVKSFLDKKRDEKSKCQNQGGRWKDKSCSCDLSNIRGKTKSKNIRNEGGGSSSKTEVWNENNKNKGNSNSNSRIQNDLQNTNIPSGNSNSQIKKQKINTKNKKSSERTNPKYESNKRKCSDCGKGIFNLCDSKECLSIGNCYFKSSGFFSKDCLPTPKKDEETNKEEINQNSLDESSNIESKNGFFSGILKFFKGFFTGKVIDERKESQKSFDEERIFNCGNNLGCFKYYLKKCEPAIYKPLIIHGNYNPDKITKILGRINGRCEIEVYKKSKSKLRFLLNLFSINVDYKKCSYKSSNIINLLKTEDPCLKDISPIPSFNDLKRISKDYLKY